MRYAELHCHTNFSFLDGASHADEIVRRAVDLGYSALGVTDHDGFRGVVKVHEAARYHGLPVVYGTEIGLPRPEPSGDIQSPLEGLQPRELAGPVDSGQQTPMSPRRGRIRRMHGSKPVNIEPTDHLVLLAPDPKGYAAISLFVTKGQYRGEKDRPVYSYADLEAAARHGDLVALSGCWQGAVARAATDNDLPGAMRAVSRLREIFGDRFCSSSGITACRRTIRATI